jgi:long-chain acyl-CoA synthetase
MNRAQSSLWLYDRWLETAEKFADQLALVDFASSQRWKFKELAALSTAGSSKAPIVFPSGQKAEFVLAILRAWHAGQIVCPLEFGQIPPVLGEVPTGFAHLKLTSASSGAAKCIAFAAEQLAADPANIVATMGLRPEWPNLACISLSHSYGFSNFILPLLLHGIPLVILPAPLPEMLLQAAREFSAITLAGVPALWRTWHESNSIPPNVKLAISAGAPLALQLEQEVFAKRGLKIHNFYGSSECGGIAYDRSNHPRTDSSFAGSALDNVSLSLSSAGTLVVKSGAVGQTYWPEAQPNLEAPIFETTDLAEIQDGGVFLLGRATDLINVAGRKVNPETIEAALRQHSAVVECVVFGSTEMSGDRFERIVACVHPREAIDFADMNCFLSERLPAWQLPREMWFTRELLPNTRGKISRADWKRRFTEMRSRARSSVT